MTLRWCAIVAASTPLICVPPFEGVSSPPYSPHKTFSQYSSTTEGSVRRFAMCCCAVVLVGCSQSKDQPAMDEMADTTAVAAPVPIALADVAGKWSVRLMPESGDSTLLSYDMVATADTSGWAFNFPKRKPVPLRVVAVDGDSIVTEAGPFESNLRKGVKVTSRTVSRLQDGKLVGATTARYATSGPDTVAHFRFEGTRAP